MTRILDAGRFVARHFFWQTDFLRFRERRSNELTLSQEIYGLCTSLSFLSSLVGIGLGSKHKIGNARSRFWIRGSRSSPIH